jgi:hypothetical protein
MEAHPAITIGCVKLARTMISRFMLNPAVARYVFKTMSCVGIVAAMEKK